MTRVAIDYDPDFRALTCGGCGSAFAIPYARYRQYAEQGASVRCPNPKCDWGSMHRSETEVQKLEKKLEAERQRAERAHQAREWAEKQLAATKGQLTKLSKRVSHGVCPCCNRSFQNVKRHMATKHPEFKP